MAAWFNIVDSNTLDTAPNTPLSILPAVFFIPSLILSASVLFVAFCVLSAIGFRVWSYLSGTVGTEVLPELLPELPDLPELLGL